MCYVLFLDVTKRHGERAREKGRGNNNDLSHVPSKIKEEIKSGTYGCGSFVVIYCQPAINIDRLHKNDCHFAGRGLKKNEVE